MAKEIEELRAELAALRERLAALEADLKVEQRINIVARRKTSGCRVCRQPPELGEGHPAVTTLEREFCERGHRFQMLSADQERTLRGEW
jgi:hypothetical protein